MIACADTARDSPFYTTEAPDVFASILAAVGLQNSLKRTSYLLYFTPVHWRTHRIELSPLYGMLRAPLEYSNGSINLWLSALNLASVRYRVVKGSSEVHQGKWTQRCKMMKWSRDGEGIIRCLTEPRGDSVISLSYANCCGTWLPIRRCLWGNRR